MVTDAPTEPCAGTPVMRPTKPPDVASGASAPNSAARGAADEPWANATAKPTSAQTITTGRLMQTLNVMAMAFRSRSSRILYFDLARHNLELRGLAEERLPRDRAAVATRR